MSPLLVIFSALFGAASAAFLPRLACRLAVPAGEPARRACSSCLLAYGGWVRAGPHCPCARAPLAVPVGAVIGALLAIAVGADPTLPVYLLAAVPGLLLAMVDLRCLRLPDRLVLVFLLVAAVPCAVLRPDRIGTAVAAGALSGAAYLGLALLPRAGLGLGDVKLGAALGVVLGFAGWPAVLAGLAAPHLINGPVAVFLLLTGRAGRRTQIAFGPALLAGALVAVPFTTA